MDKIKVMVNGIPGNVAKNLTRHILSDNRFHLVPASLTGPEITEKAHQVDSIQIQLISPPDREKDIVAIKEKEGDFISIDYTHPSAVNSNAGFYCKHSLPFVMGTTGGDRKLLMDTVKSASIPAVIAPNMAKQIVGFQAMMEYAAETFPGIFKEFSLEIKESHQKGKADTSGTAKAMVKYFNQMGVPFSEDDIIMERDPVAQKEVWGIPEAYLGGHAWHTYTLVSKDKTTKFSFTHNINGRDIYANGTMDAIVFLHRKLAQGEKGGKVFTMIDVLKG